MAQFNLDQDSYRFGNDGTEAAHTWLAAANVAINVGDSGNVAFNTTFLVRILIQEYGGKSGSNIALQLQYRINSGSWVTCTNSTPVKIVDSTNLTYGNDTTQRLGVGTFISDNNWVHDYGSSLNYSATLPTFTSGQEAEYLVAIQVDGATLNHNDQIDLQAVYNGGTVLDSYTNNPWFMISKSSTTYYQTITGSITPTGVMSKVSTFVKSIAGAITPTGVLTRVNTFVKTITGSITPTGVMSKLGTFYKSIAGAITPTGVTSKVSTLYKSIAGAITFVGTLTKLLNPSLAKIDFEEGDTSDFDTVNGTLTINSTSPLEGTYDAYCDIPNTDTSVHSGEKAIAHSTNIMSYFYRFDPNTMNGVNGNTMTIFRIETDGTGGQAQAGICQFRYNSGYEVAAWLRNDDGTYKYTGYVSLSDAPHTIEVHTGRESSDGAADGTLDWWIDGVEQTTNKITNGENYNLFPGIDGFIIGCIWRSAATFNGQPFIDEIIATDNDSMILAPAGTTYYQTITGAITFAGVLSKITTFVKSIAGTLTPTGTLTKITTIYKTITGAITPTGTLTRLGTFYKTIAGSLTPTGALTKITTFVKSIAGAITFAGVLAYKTVIGILIEGAITFTGVLTRVNTFVKTITGSITPTGVMSKLGTFYKSIAGTIAPSGSLIYNLIGVIQMVITGQVTFTGTLSKVTTIYKSITGAISFVGSLSSVKTAYQTITGAITFIGTLTPVKVLQQLITGAVTFVGTVTKQSVIGMLITGEITFAGALSKITTFVKSIAGSLTPTGALTRLGTFYKTITGGIAPTGALTRLGTFYKTITGNLTPIGTLIVTAKGAAEWFLDLVLRRRRVIDLTLSPRSIADAQLQPRGLVDLNLPNKDLDK